MENQPITLRGFFQSIDEWLVDAVEWGIETYNQFIDLDFRPLLPYFGLVVAFSFGLWIYNGFIQPLYQQKMMERDEEQRRKKRRDLGYDDEEE